MNDIDKTLNNAKEILDSRQEKGVKTYGTTLDEANLSDKELLNHAIEEVADLFLYLTKLKIKLAQHPTSEIISNMGLLYKYNFENAENEIVFLKKKIEQLQIQLYEKQKKIEELIDDYLNKKYMRVGLKSIFTKIFKRKNK